MADEVLGVGLLAGLVEEPDSVAADEGAGASIGEAGCTGVLSPWELEPVEVPGAVEAPVEGTSVEGAPAGTEPAPVEPGGPDVPEDPAIPAE